MFDPRSSTGRLRLATPEDREELATLIRDSTNQYYIEHLGRSAIFDPQALSTLDMVDLYDALEGSGCVVCIGGAGQLIGSCFFHERARHLSLGIMNVHPGHFGKGIAKELLQAILDHAAGLDLAVRLVSSCLNLASYSLYTRAGFSPYEFYQDMLFQVPDAGYAISPGVGIEVRTATLDDLETICALERQVSKIERRGDHLHFLRNPDGHWHVSLAFLNGEPSGFLASCGSAACNMIGPGVMLDESSAKDLILHELNQYPGRTPVALLPGRFPNLVQALYDVGGRNCELHVAQSTRPTPPPAGISMPTFLPESA